MLSIPGNFLFLNLFKLLIISFLLVLYLYPAPPCPSHQQHSVDLVDLTLLSLKLCSEVILTPSFDLTGTLLLNLLLVILFVIPYNGSCSYLWAASSFSLAKASKYFLLSDRKSYLTSLCGFLFYFFIPIVESLRCCIYLALHFTAFSVLLPTLIRDPYGSFSLLQS